MTFGPLDELARRPDATVLVVHVPEEFVDDEGQLAAAREKYAAMVVVPLKGHQADASALSGRDVVLWPWKGRPGRRAELEPFEAALSHSAKRLRVIVPKSPDDWLGPADLNGHDPIGWARAQCLVIPPREAVDLEKEWFGGAEPEPVEHVNGAPALIEETHQRVNLWVPPDDWPTPVDIFSRAPLPILAEAMLPPALAPFIFDQSAIIGSDPCILAMAALVSCAAVTSDAIKLQPKANEHGWRESARLWGAFVGDPSVKKTPPMNRATAHLRKLDMDNAERGQEAMRHYKLERKVYDKAEARWIDQQSKHVPCGPPPDPPERPAIQRIIVQDATIEAVAQILVDNPQGVFAIFDELSGFFGAMDAYRAQGGKDRAFWLQAYNGGPYAVDRVSREALPVPNLSVCMLGGIQPAAIRAIAGKSVEDGLLQRFMIVVAQGGEAIGEDRRADQSALALYRGVLDHLAAQAPTGDEPIELDADARAVMFHVEQKLAGFCALDSLPIRMRYQLGKWSGLFARLCLAYHAIESAALGMPIQGRIAGDLAKRVDRFLFEFLFWHLQHFYETVIGDSEPEAALVHKVARWLLARAPDRFTGWHISKGVTAWRGAHWLIRKRVMDQLENCGWVVKDDRHRFGNEAWRLNERVRSDFKDVAEAEEKRREVARSKIMNDQNRGNLNEV